MMKELERVVLTTETAAVVTVETADVRPVGRRA
jgi:hypothetical protein